jgi:putative ABC transport system permease protein
LGASVADTVVLLSKEFLKLIAISFIIASPVAWVIMHNWLSNYEYRIAVQWWVFTSTGLLTFVIAMVTVSFQAIKAAMANPIKSLRIE